MNSAHSLRHIPEILLVEDNPGDILLVKESFRESRQPHKLNVVKDGEEALDFIDRRGSYQNAPTPDLVLLDLNLPKVSGHDVLAHIKSNPQFQKIPVLVLSTSCAPSDVHRAYALCANCYVCKPAELHQFFQLMRTLQEFWLGMVRLTSAEDAAWN